MKPNFTIEELQEKSYIFTFDGYGMTDTITVGMIGDIACRIGDADGIAYLKRNVKTNEELNDFLEIEDFNYYDNDGFEEHDPLTFADLSYKEIEEC